MHLNSGSESIINENDVIAVSQSGETADTLAAIKLAKQGGATIIGICNVVGSSISRETHAGSYTHAVLRSECSTKVYSTGNGFSSDGTVARET